MHVLYDILYTFNSFFIGRDISNIYIHILSQFFIIFLTGILQYIQWYFCIQTHMYCCTDTQAHVWRNRLGNTWSGRHYCRHTMTGQWAWWTTKSLTLPRIVRRILPRPRVPITTIVAFSSSDTLQIISPGLLLPHSVLILPEIWKKINK